MRTFTPTHTQRRGSVSARILSTAAMVRPSRLSCVLVFLLSLAEVVEMQSSVPVYGRYETCVVSEPLEYQNPFNYTEVASELLPHN